MQPEEAKHWRYVELTWPNGHVKITRLKQRKNAIINTQPLHPREKELIERYAAQAGTARLFPGHQATRVA